MANKFLFVNLILKRNLSSLRFLLLDVLKLMIQVYVPQNIRKIYFLHKISRTRF